jgi:glycerol-1-phosphate dehydrogenase [NAD(P)+]
MDLNRASASFDLLEATLGRELSEPVRLSTTSNHLARGRSELESALLQALGGTLHGKRVLVFSDGVRKESGVGRMSIDELVLECLRAAGAVLESVSLSELLECTPEQVHASVEAAQAVESCLSTRMKAPVVVVGSGSVTDIVKQALHALQWADIPFVVLPTALTVTAFTSHFAVLEEAGAKRTRVSRRVDFCLWFTPVLASAPVEMSRAGYGDLLARFVAYGDWYLGWKLGVAQRYDELAFRLMEPFGFHLRRHASAFADWPVAAEAIEDLSALLAMAGIAMSVSGETTPLSGYEHAVSHALDYLRLTSRRPLSWHGQQVGLASLASALSYDHLLSLDTIELQQVRPQSTERVKKTISQLLQSAPYFGAGEASLTAEERKEGLSPFQSQIDAAATIFTRDYLVKHELWCEAHTRISSFEKEWPEIRSHLRSLVIPASEMESLLQLSGLALIPEELAQPTTALEYRWAVRFAPFVRSRMSLGDLIFWLGEDPALWAML